MKPYAKHKLAGLSVLVAFLVAFYASSASANGGSSSGGRYENYCDSSRFGLSSRCGYELVCASDCSYYNSYGTVPHSGSSSSRYSVPSDPSRTLPYNIRGLYGRYDGGKTNFRFRIESDRAGVNLGVKIYYDWNGNGWDRVESFDSYHFKSAGKSEWWYASRPSSVRGDSYQSFYNGRIKVVFWQWGETQGNVRVFTDCSGGDYASYIDIPYSGNNYNPGQGGYYPGQGGYNGGHHGGYEHDRDKRQPGQGGPGQGGPGHGGPGQGGPGHGGPGQGGPGQGGPGHGGPGHGGPGQGGPGHGGPGHGGPGHGGPGQGGPGHGGPGHGGPGHGGPGHGGPGQGGPGHGGPGHGGPGHGGPGHGGPGQGGGGHHGGGHHGGGYPGGGGYYPGKPGHGGGYPGGGGGGYYPPPGHGGYNRGIRYSSSCRVY